VRRRWFVACLLSMPWIVTLEPAHARCAPARQALADARLAAGYLAAAVGPSGRMRYVTYPQAPGRTPGRYNVLRHTGAMYAMADALDRGAAGAQRSALGAALLRAAGYLRRCCIDAVPEGRGMLAVWTRPAVTGRERAELAKLGGAGLGLVALAGTERRVPGSVGRELLRGLARFVLFMQKPDGAFHSLYVPSEGGRQDEWTSLYYPGEAALGLLALYDLDPEPDWLAAAARALQHLARTRRGRDRVPADHWALIATARLLKVASDMPQRVDAPLLLGHAVQVVRSMVQEQDAAAGSFPGAFTPDGRTTPTATRLEGLLAVRPILTDRALVGRVDSAIDRGIALLRDAIIREGPLAGGVPRAVRELADDGTAARRRFNRRASEIRIDYVQHALSALLGYARHAQVHHCADGSSAG